MEGADCLASLGEVLRDDLHLEGTVGALWSPGGARHLLPDLGEEEHSVVEWLSPCWLLVDGSHWAGVVHQAVPVASLDETIA